MAVNSRSLWSISLATVALSVTLSSTAKIAQAFTLTQTSGTTSQVSDLTGTIGFNGLSGSVPNTATGIAPGVTIQRISGVAQYLNNQGTVPSDTALPYLNIGGGPNSSSELAGGRVALNFAGLGQPLNYFGLYWGSLDIIPTNANVISFFRGGSLVRSFTGLQVADALPGQQTLLSQYINFSSTDASEYFDRVELSNADLFAYEVDNLSYRAIPTPALLPGLVGMGVGFLRKKRKEQEG